MEDGKITTGAVADRMGISERELQNLIRGGIIKAPPLREGWGRRYWTDEQIDDAQAAYHDWAKAKKRKEKARGRK